MDNPQDVVFQGTIRWRRHDSTLDIQIDGRGTIPQSLAVRRWVDDSYRSPIKTLRIFLSHCNYMDSTFIGTLLYFKRLLAKMPGTFVLVQPSSECRQLLSKMGILRIFNVYDEVSALDDAMHGNWQPLPIEAVSPCSVEFKENVCNAHQQLADEEASRDQFVGVAAQLQRELAREREKSPLALKVGQVADLP